MLALRHKAPARGTLAEPGAAYLFAPNGMATDKMPRWHTGPLPGSFILDPMAGNGMVNAALMLGSSGSARRQAMMQFFHQLVQFLQQGISAIFRFVQMIWTWSVGQITQVVQSPWPGSPQRLTQRWRLEDRWGSRARPAIRERSG